MESASAPADELGRRDVPAGGALSVFRLVRTNDRGAPEFIDGFRSNHELGKPPRGRERRLPEIHAGLSVYKTLEQARALRASIAAGLARKGGGTQPRIGDYVAELRLPDGMGFAFEDRDEPTGHLTIWGEAEAIAGCTVDIHPAYGIR